MANILVATLGDSPVVVTSTFDLLTKENSLNIDGVVLLYPQGDNRESGFIVIDEVLKGRCSVKPYELPFEDTYTEESCFVFLQSLFALLGCLKQQGDTVYLSLAGGRKHMSALIALAAPFYSCVQGLYHVIDENEYTNKQNFKSIRELKRIYEAKDKILLEKVMFPGEGVQLVIIPIENALRVPETYLQKLLKKTPEQLQELWEEDPDKADEEQFMLTIVSPNSVEPLLDVYLTEQAKEEYEHCGANFKEQFAQCFKHMRSATNFANKKHGPLSDPKREKPYSCYVYKKGRTPERPFFHEEPGQVIVERLARHRTEEEYIPSVKELLRTTYNKDDKLYTVEEVLTSGKLIPSVLIVPIGTQPMGATQLYTLLITRARRDIQKVILLYLEDNDAVYNSFQIAKDAFKRERVSCEEKSIQGMSDLISEKDCLNYQNELEQLIKGLQEEYLRRHLDVRIDLAPSGRKAMAALALFAAQRTQLSAVYHTIISNKELDRRIEFEMTDQEFNKLKPQEKNEKLFLRAYQAYETNFRLFKVPIGPLHRK